MARDTKHTVKDIPLTGRLITAIDGVFISGHFSELLNLRYSNYGLEGVGGMSKINSTALTTYTNILNGYHFKKDQPEESHIVVQAWNTGQTASVVYRNSIAIPGTGDFNSTVLHTDADGSTIGRFDTAPNGELLYCNGEESLIWGGDEFKVSKFINYDPGGAFKYDFTIEVNNDLDDSENIAVLEGQSGGNTSDVVLLLDLDNDVVDSSVGGATHTVTNNNVTFASGDDTFGTHHAVFNGTNATLTVPNHADFDLNSDGIWSLDFRCSVTSLSSINSMLHQSHDVSKVPFNSGSEEPASGDTLSGAVSGETLVVHAVTVDTGTWVGGDAVGHIWTRSVDLSGAFNATELIDNDTQVLTNIASTNGTTDTSAGTDFTCVRINTDGSVQLCMYETHLDDNAVDLQTAAGIIVTGTTYHIEITENENDWYMFVDGALKAHTSDVSRFEEHDSVITIGSDGTYFFDGVLDEIRLSQTAQHVANFEIPSEPYSTSSSISYMYIGSLRPLQGFKYYMKTVNSSTSTMTVEYWDGSSWTSVVGLVDGTTSGGVSLAQTGDVSFTSTSTVARTSIIDQTYVYWYKVTVDDLDAGTSISQVTTNEPMQKIRDIWDGNFRSCLNFFKYNGTSYLDGSISVFEEDFSSANTASYSNIGSLTTSQYLVAGFPERISALSFVLVDDKVNTNAAIAEIEYWDGSSWNSVSGLEDGTISSGKSFTKSGTLSWQSPDKDGEFKQEISKEIPLYYYKISFTATLSTNIYIDSVTGIPAQLSINNYKFPLVAQDRVWLCGEVSGGKNSVISSARGTSVVFNGEDSVRIYFGDNTDIIAGTNLYSQFGSSLYDLIVFCKKNETWLVSGGSPSDWVKYKASDKIGCVAPLTMVKAHASFETIPGLNRYIAIWQASDGIYIFDGRNFYPIHADIKDLFDIKNSSGLNLDVVDKCSAFYDNFYDEYHWICATGDSTELNREFAYDLAKQRWFEIDRGTGKRLQVVIPVQDTIGNKYNYGAITTGYIERLENGYTFDGGDIEHSFQIGNLGLADNFYTESVLRGVRLVCKVKNTTSNNVSMEYFVNSELVSNDSFNNVEIGKSGVSVVYLDKHVGNRNGISHSLRFSLTTNDEVYGFEPYVVSVDYKTKGLDTH